MKQLNMHSITLRKQRVVLAGALLAVVFAWSQQTLRAQLTESGTILTATGSLAEETDATEGTEATESNSLESSASSLSGSALEVTDETETAIESSDSSSASSDSSESSVTSDQSSTSSVDAESSSSEVSPASDSSVSSESSQSSSIAFEVSTLDEQPADLRPSNVFPSFSIGHTAEISSAEELDERIRLTLSDGSGAIIDVDHDITELDDGYRVMLVPTQNTFTPGQYRLIATLDGTRGVTRLLQRIFRATEGEAEDAVLLDELFQWGTVAVNAHKDSYAFGSTARVSAAVINKAGVPLCIPEIIGSFDDFSDVSVTEFCNDKTIEIAVPSATNPTLTIHANNALRNRTVQQVIETSENQPVISLERIGSTRTSPGMEETMDIIVTANQTFNGRLVETVPAGFVVTGTTPVATLDEEDERTTITWEGQWTAGTSRKVSYTITVPRDAPIFALFGPIEMRGDLEGSAVVQQEEASSSSEETEAIEEIEATSSSSSSDSSVTSESSDSSDSTSSASSESSLSGEAPAGAESDESFDSSESSESSSSEASKEVIEEHETGSGSTSFIQNFFNAVLAALTIGDNQVSYTENRQWQMLSAEGESVTWETIRERTLTLQRTAQVFDAQSTPAFTIVDTEIPHPSGYGPGRTGTGTSATLSTQVAMEEILHAVISENDVKDAADEDLSATDVTLLKEELVETVAHGVVADESAEEVAEEVIAKQSESPDMVQPKDAQALTGTASVLTIMLVGPNGQPIENPGFHFKQGSVVLVIDPIDNFFPGLYTLTVLVTNPVTGEVTTMHQQFAWGVLALNTDKDVYETDDTADIHIGVLDDFGEIVCSAELTLDVVSPSGDTMSFTTADGSIEETETCAKKEAGFIDPDFRMSLPLTEQGAYELTLTAVTENGTRALASTITVNDNSLYSIERHAATRLWPFAPSPMDIAVTFNRAIEGTIVEYLPAGFEPDDISHGGEAHAQEDGTTAIRWHGSWDEGETLELHYDYDAPDISPHFYLIGPLRIFSNEPLTPEQ